MLDQVIDYDATTWDKVDQVSPRGWLSRSVGVATYGPPAPCPFLPGVQMDVEEEQYQLRPMNCPFHIAVYKDRARSYRELPMRWAELGTVYRYERSGTMHGLFRVRGFTQVSGLGGQGLR